MYINVYLDSLEEVLQELELFDNDDRFMDYLSPGQKVRFEYALSTLNHILQEFREKEI